MAILLLTCAAVALSTLVSPVVATEEGAKSPQQNIMDLGYPNCGAGWFDIQGQGVDNDYCRWVGNCGCRGLCSFWSCALAGSNMQYTPKGQYFEQNLDDTVVFLSNGDAGIQLEKKMGTYTKTSQLVRGFPVYEQNIKNLDRKQFLFVGPDGNWTVGPPPTLKNPQRSQTPPRTGWEYRRLDKWIKDDSIEAILKVKADYVYDWGENKYIFVDEQCPNIGNNPGMDITACKRKCSDTPTCSAINVRIDGERLDCVLRACHLPVPSPYWQMRGYKSYFKKVTVRSTTSTTTTTGTTTTSTTTTTTTRMTTPTEVVLITGGMPNPRSVEVFGKPGCSPSLVLPDDRYGHTSHYIDGKVLICGGGKWYESRISCLQLLDGKFIPHSQLKEQRRYHSGVILSGKLSLMGGSTQWTETLNGTTWTYGTDMEYPSRGSCVVTFDDRWAMVIGSGKYSTDVYLYDVEEGWNKKRNLPGAAGRRFHSCVVLSKGKVLVAGGTDVNFKDLDTAVRYNGYFWHRLAGKLSNTRSYGQMVKVNGRILYFGGRLGNERSLKTTDTVEEFDEDTWSWTLLEQRMETPRKEFSAVVVPASAVGCGP